MNNFEKIKNMSIKKLASFLREQETSGCGSCIFKEDTTCNNQCFDGTREWLEQEAK